MPSIDQPSTRFALALVAGVPATIVIVPLAILGIINGLDFIAKNWLAAAQMIAASFLGIMGLVGAWHRLVHTQSSLDAVAGRRSRIVWFLICGLVSATLWMLFLWHGAMWRLWSDFLLVSMVTLMAPILAAYLISRTMKSKPNLRFENDATRRAPHGAPQPGR